MRILAVDYGDARTGLAICDPGEQLASPLGTICQRDPEKTAEAAAKAALEAGARRIVVGNPINMDGTARERSQACRDFAALLEQRSGLPVVLWDERRTTIDAHQILMNSGKNAKQRKKNVDAVAASLILEGYLTYKKSNP